MAELGPRVIYCMFRKFIDWEFASATKNIHILIKGKILCQLLTSAVTDYDENLYGSKED